MIKLIDYHAVFKEKRSSVKPSHLSVPPPPDFTDDLNVKFYQLL